MHVAHQKQEVNLAIFERINIENASAFDAAMLIYESAFPVNERQPVQLIKQRVESGANELYICYLDQQVVFMAMLWPLLPGQFILLDYMATHEAHQGKKIAADFLLEMNKVLQKDRKYFILEVEDPAFGNNKIQRQKRIDFYKRYGAEILTGIRYTLPAIQGNLSTEMLLMIYPAYSSKTIDGGLVKKIIIQVYKELYNLSEPIALLNSCGYNEKTGIVLD